MKYYSSIPYVAFNRLKTTRDRVRYLLSLDEQGEILDSLYIIKRWWDFKETNSSHSLFTFCEDYDLPYHDISMLMTKLRSFANSKRGYDNLIDTLKTYEMITSKTKKADHLNALEEYYNNIEEEKERLKLEEQQNREDEIMTQKKSEKSKEELEVLENESENINEELPEESEPEKVKPAKTAKTTTTNSGNKIYDKAVKSLKENTEMESVYKDIDEDETDEDMSSGGGVPYNDIPDIPDGGSRNFGLTALFVAGSAFVIGLVIYLVIKKKKPKTTVEVEPLVQYPGPEKNSPTLRRTESSNIKIQPEEDQVPPHLSDLIPNKGAAPKSLNELLGGK